MPYTVGGGFKALLEDLELTPSQKATADGRVNHLVTYFTNADIVCSELPFKTGSYDRGTVIRWKRDIDVMVALHYCLDAEVDVFRHHSAGPRKTSGRDRPADGLVCQLFLGDVAQEHWGNIPLGPMMEWRGEAFPPYVSSFPDSTLAYVERRAAEASRDDAKARYHDYLWCHRRSNQDAQGAVRAYRRAGVGTDPDDPTEQSCGCPPAASSASRYPTGDGETPSIQRPSRSTSGSTGRGSWPKSAYTRRPARRTCTT